MCGAAPIWASATVGAHASIVMVLGIGFGHITLEELRSIMRSLGREPTLRELQDMIREVDVDGNGTIEFDEFLNVIAMRTKEAADAELREAFKLMSVMTNMGEEVTKEIAAAMIMEVDADGDGQVDFEEFSTVMMAIGATPTNSFFLHCT
ncbi:hypothetical protein BHE74_00011887 [Ensete ventricosum]|nr:hypothetical protein GW17_00018056 [Ensete ventricosum]RWW79811.1 hypothetical protein BHE74_00011887 [Ensete ventricosum]